MSTPKESKRLVKAHTLGVIVGWLRHENRYHESCSDDEARWVEELQDSLAKTLEKRIAKLLRK